MIIILLSLILMCLGFIIGNIFGEVQGKLQNKSFPETIKIEIVNPHKTVEAEIIDAEYIDVLTPGEPYVNPNRLLTQKALKAYKESDQYSASMPQHLHLYV